MSDALKRIEERYPYSSQIPPHSDLRKLARAGAAVCDSFFGGYTDEEIKRCPENGSLFARVRKLSRVLREVAGGDDD